MSPPIHPSTYPPTHLFFIRPTRLLLLNIDGVSFIRTQYLQSQWESIDFHLIFKCLLARQHLGDGASKMIVRDDCTSDRNLIPDQRSFHTRRLKCLLKSNCHIMSISTWRTWQKSYLFGNYNNAHSP